MRGGPRATGNAYARRSRAPAPPAHPQNGGFAVRGCKKWEHGHARPGGPLGTHIRVKSELFPGGLVPRTGASQMRHDLNPQCDAMVARSLGTAARRRCGAPGRAPPPRASPLVLWSRAGGHTPRAAPLGGAGSPNTAPPFAANGTPARPALAGPGRRPQPTAAARRAAVLAPGPCRAPGPVCAPFGRGAGCPPRAAPVGGEAHPRAAGATGVLAAGARRQPLAAAARAARARRAARAASSLAPWAPQLRRRSTPGVEEGAGRRRVKGEDG